MSLRAFSDWETGKSDELKGSSLVRAMVYLRGSWEDIVTLVMSDLRDEDAEKLASNQLQQATVSDQVNADEMQELINDLWKDAKLRMAFIAFWSGWKAKDTSTGA